MAQVCGRSPQPLVSFAKKAPHSPSHSVPMFPPIDSKFLHSEKLQPTDNFCAERNQALYDELLKELETPGMLITKKFDFYTPTKTEKKLHVVEFACLYSEVNPKEIKLLDKLIAIKHPVPAYLNRMGLKFLCPDIPESLIDSLVQLPRFELEVNPEGCKLA